jgi:8-oxo-dGTP diphosphatase
MTLVAKALIYDEDKNILVLQRSETHPKYANHPDFPGGEVEESETPEQGLAREIYEEAGLNIKTNELKLVVEKQISKNLNYLLYSIQLKRNKPPITLSWEHSMFEWLSLNMLKAKEIPKGADDYYLMVLEYLNKY